MPTLSQTWSNFLPYQSAAFSQNYLRRIYESKKIDEPLNKSYQNGYTFTYYLIHGQRFFHQSELAPYEIKPLLLFYGLVQLCKACLLTVDQDYPENSTVLAHGVSTRKLKKQSFEFLQDTVLVQKKGLFSHMASTLFGLKALEGQKLQMEHLIRYLPEIDPIYSKIKGRHLCRPVNPVSSNGSFQISNQVLKDLKLSEERFYQFFKTYFTRSKEHSPDCLAFFLTKETKSNEVFLINQQEQLFLSGFRDTYPVLPELLVHYLILYNLSMISRYETEWWNDLFLQRSSQDISFIQAFIDLTTTKIPWLVNEFLEAQEP